MTTIIPPAITDLTQGFLNEPSRSICYYYITNAMPTSRLSTPPPARRNLSGWLHQLLYRAKAFLSPLGGRVGAAIKFEASLAAMSDAVFIIDREGRLVNFNDAFLRFHRFASAEECKQRVTDFQEIFDVCDLSGTSLPLEAWSLPRALRGETATNVEFKLRRRDRPEVWFGSYSYAPIRASDESIVGAVATARDVTRSKEVEGELRNTSYRLNLALKSAHLGVFDWDITTGIVHWDDRLLELYGLRHEDFSGTFEDWRQRLHPEDRARVLAEVDAALKGKGDYDTEFRVVHPNGDLLYLKANGVVLRASDGTPERFLGVNADVTVRKTAEAELKRAYAEVEAKVTQRTAALEAAKIAAENASRAKDLFLATLSHELRSPLAAILSWSQLMERGGIPPEKMQMGIRTIKENVWSQNQLISDLLDISRITTGKLALDLQPTNVHEVVTAAIDTIRLTAEERGVAIVETLNGTGLYINADPARLKQVLWNLLSNAVKFTPSRGTIFVTVWSRGEECQQELVIEVRDSGRGIKPEFIPHLFDTFSQADPSSIRVHGGMGLGLSLVKNLVHLQGGTVSGESPGEGKGSTFTLTFPILTVSERFSPMSRSITPSTRPIPTEELRDMKVLLVEDGEKTRVALHHLLEAHGAKVHSSASAQEAMEAIASEKPDIIVSDIAMPQEDGHSLLRKIRATKGEWGATVPAIALTAFAEPKDRSEAFASGFQEYLTKPVDEAVLTSTLVRLVTNHPASPSVH